jgi:hypothetical protein
MEQESTFGNQSVLISNKQLAGMGKVFEVISGQRLIQSCTSKVDYVFKNIGHTIFIS